MHRLCTGYPRVVDNLWIVWITYAQLFICTVVGVVSIFFTQNPAKRRKTLHNPGVGNLYTKVEILYTKFLDNLQNSKILATSAERAERAKPLDGLPKF